MVTPSTASIPVALKNFDSLPDTANVKLPVVMALYARSAASVWRDVQAKRIPAPRSLGLRNTGWTVGELRAHLMAA